MNLISIPTRLPASTLTPQVPPPPLTLLCLSGQNPAQTSQSCFQSQLDHVVPVLRTDQNQFPAEPLAQMGPGKRLVYRSYLPCLAICYLTYRKSQVCAEARARPHPDWTLGSRDVQKQAETSRKPAKGKDWGSCTAARGSLCLGLQPRESQLLSARPASSVSQRTSVASPTYCLTLEYITVLQNESR